MHDGKSKWSPAYNARAYESKRQQQIADRKIDIGAGVIKTHSIERQCLKCSKTFTAEGCKKTYRFIRLCYFCKHLFKNSLEYRI